MDKELEKLKTTLFKDDDLNDHFEEKGYVTVPLLDGASVERLRTLYFAKADIELIEEFNETTRRLDAKTNSLISETLKHAFEQGAKSVLTNYAIMGGTFFIKKAHSLNEFPIHQDWNLVDETKYYSALIWCPLQDVTEKNGAIQLIPRSHKFFENTYRSGSIHPPRFPSAIFVEAQMAHALQTIELKAGEALIYQSGLYHGSHPNHTAENRLIATGSLIPQNAELVYYHWPNVAENRIEQIDASKDFYLRHIDDLANGRLPKDATVLKSIAVRPLYPTAEDLLAKTGQAYSIDDTTIMGSNPHAQDYTIFSKHNEKIPFWKVYSPKNIALEIKHRLGLTQFFSQNSKDSNNLKKDLKSKGSAHTDSDHPKKTGAFYDDHHAAFLQVYGNVIQAFRTKDVALLLDGQIKSLNLKKGQHILDAGCGICAPACHFAQAVDVTIDAITISRKQFLAAQENVSKHGLNKKIKVIHGDYHNLEQYYPDDSFDTVYFLESLGHSRDKATVLKSVWQVLKPGGRVYIKDLFRKVSHDAHLQESIDREICGINEAYHYQVADLNDFLNLVRKQGYIIEFIKTIDLPLSEFEDLAISNVFQELTGIGKIKDWENYIFPIDFFEIRLMKTQYGLDKGRDRYFLQNMYRVQVENWEERNL